MLLGGSAEDLGLGGKGGERVGKGVLTAGGRGVPESLYIRARGSSVPAHRRRSRPLRARCAAVLLPSAARRGGRVQSAASLGPELPAGRMGAHRRSRCPRCSLQRASRGGEESGSGELCACCPVIYIEELALRPAVRSQQHTVWFWERNVFVRVTG